MNDQPLQENSVVGLCVDRCAARATNALVGALLAGAWVACWVLMTTLLKPAYAAPLDAAASSVSATFRQLGVPVSGKFRQMQGDIEFDAARPTAAKASIAIAVASFDLGDKDYNAEVAKKDWFDASRHPQATFALKQVTGVADALRAEGVLAIKGRSVSVQFPVVVKTVAGRTAFEGRVPVSRLAFGIGEGEWRDTALVADEVIVEFRLVAAAAASAPLSPPSSTSGKPGAGPSGTNPSANRADSQDSKKDIRK